MTATPIFDALHRELNAPQMTFCDPDGGIVMYGIRIWLPGGDPDDGHFGWRQSETTILALEPPPALNNFPPLIGGTE